MSSKNPVIMTNFQIEIPSSKSEFQREVAISLLTDEPSEIRFTSISDDALTAIRLAEELGAITYNDKFYYYCKNCDRESFSKINSDFINDLYNNLKINSKVYSDDLDCLAIHVSSAKKLQVESINCGESGLSLHLFSVIASALSRITSITGCGTLLNRKQSDLIYTLSETGLTIQHNHEKLPISIWGESTANSIKLSKLSGSQSLSALLILYAKLGIGATIEVENLKSKNYVAMTIDALARHNVEVINENFERFIVPTECELHSASVRVESCWSSASFWFVLAASKGNITITGLNPHSKQPDRAIIEVLQSCGAEFDLVNNTYRFDSPADKLIPFNFDANDCPDLIPNLVILAAMCNGESIISGANRLENKESNRADAIMNEFTKIGINIERFGDKFIVRRSDIIPAEVKSYSDHRITMALELAAAIAEVNIIIDSSQNVSKSYPEFYRHLSNYKQSLSK